MISTKMLFEKCGIYLFLVLLVLIASVASPAFLKPQNLRDILNQAAALGMVSIGQTFVILSGNGGIDLSVASVMATVAVIASKISRGQDALFLPTTVICVLFGALVGAVNGLLITKRKVPPILATLGMMIIIHGIRFLYTKGAPTGDFPPFLRFLGTGNFGLIPISTLSLAILAIVATIILKKTVFGRQVYTVGGNINVAKLSGYNTELIIITVYIISGLAAAIAGLYLAGWLAILDNWVGKGYEIDSIAVVVMGGTSFEGGRGGVFGTIAAVFIISILYNIVILLHLPIDAQLIIKGTAIILAASFYVRRGIR